MNNKNNKEMEIPISPEVASGEIQLAKYWLSPCGLASDTVYATIDSKIALRQPHPNNEIYLCPIRNMPQPNYEEAWFYNDCIAYEHEIPSIVYPTKKEIQSFKHRYYHVGSLKPQRQTIINLNDQNSNKIETYYTKPRSHQKLVDTFFIDDLLLILDQTRKLRQGPFSFILFKSYNLEKQINLNYTQDYLNVSKELILYSSSLRQADFLSEYLCLYRVIESATNSNGKAWIEDALDRALNYRYAKITIASNAPVFTKRNLISVFKRRYSSRHKQLKKSFNSNKEIAKYLYNINRCGIAHGKRAIVSPIYGFSYFEIVKDISILKLLARLAIEEKRNV